jgi:hypothetical protein
LARSDLTPFSHVALVLVPHGDSPPLHVHHTEDEVFRVIAGELRFQLDDQDLGLAAGETLFAPKGVPHTYRVESQEARWLTVTRHGDFESLVRSFSRPAATSDLPAPSGPPTPEQADALAAACLKHGIELVGPPLH